MTRAPSLAALLLAATLSPATAQEAAPEKGVQEGFSLLEEGAKIIMRSMLDEMQPALDDMGRELGLAMEEWGPALRELAARVGDLSAYHAPEILPNGDIIIRRKRLPPDLPGPNGEIDL
jgi:hypothetical protein